MEVQHFKVDVLPLKGEPNAIYFVSNGNGTDIDQYVTDKLGNFRKVSPVLPPSGGFILSNANGLSFGTAGGTVVTGSYTVPSVPTDYISTNQSSLFQHTSGMSDFLGTGYTTHVHNNYLSSNQSSLLQLTADNSLSLGTGYTTHTHPYINTNQSSLFQQTSDSSLSLGTGYTTHTHSQYLTTQTVQPQSTQPVAISGSNGSFAFSTVTFGNLNGVSFYTSNGSLVGSVAAAGAVTDYISTAQSSLFQLAADNSLSLGTGYTTHTHGQYLNTFQSSLFEMSSHTTVFLTTARASNDAIGLNTANTNVTWTVNSSGISINAGAYFNTSASSNFVLTANSSLFQHTSATSAITSNAFNTSGSSNFVLTANSSLLQHTSGTSAITSNAVHTSAARIQGLIGSNTTYTSGSVGFRDTNGISWQSTTGQSFQITHALQFTSNTSAITSNAFNTSGSSNFVLTANSSLLQHTSATSAITSNALHSTVARIQGVIGSNTTYTSGSVGLRDLNGISWQSTTGQSFQITHDLQYTSNTSAITSNAFNTSGSSNFVLTANSSLLQHTSATSAITSNALHTSVARIQGIIGSNTTYTSGSVGLRDLNGISWQSTTGQSYQITHDLQYTSNTSAITSNAFNTSGSSNFVLTANSSLLQHTSATSAITSNALHSSASRVFNIVAATNNTGGGTASLSSNVSFSNANGATFYSSAGGAVALSYSVPTVPTAYVSSVNGSSGAISFATGSSLSSSSNGSTVTWGLASNITTALQSAGAYLTTADLSQNSSKYFQNWKITGNTSGTTSSAQGTDFWLSGGNGVTLSGTSNSILWSVATNYQSQGAYLTTAALSSQTLVISLGGNTGTTNSSQISNGGFVFAGGSNITLSQSNNSLSIHAQSQSNQQMTMFATGNTTQSSTGTNNASSLIFNGLGIASVGISGGSVLISVPAGGGAGDGYNIVSMLTSTSGGGTAGATFSNLSQSIGLMAGSNITISQTSNTINFVGNTFANSNGVTFGINAGTITADARTILSSFEPFPAIGKSTVLVGVPTGTSAGVSLYPFIIDEYVSAGILNMAYSMSFITVGTSSGRQTMGLAMALYTLNASTLSSIVSNSFSIGVTGNNSSYTINQVTVTSYTGFGATGATNSAGSNISSGYTGIKVIGWPINSLLSPGNYWLGMIGTNSTSSINVGISMSHMGLAMATFGSAMAPIGSFSSAYTSGMDPFGGRWSPLQGSWTSAGSVTMVPASIAQNSVTALGMTYPAMRFWRT